MQSGLWKERMTKAVVGSRQSAVSPGILCVPCGCHYLWYERNVET